MHQLRELVKVDPHFQKSINLQLDLDDSHKIESYIPTYSSVQILKQYLENIRENKKNKANVLIGPYGKGKSHLLLVLLAILCHKGSASLVKLINKIAMVDEQAAQLAARFLKADKPFLPIIINPTKGDVSQAFLLGLNTALIQVGLNEIIPDTYFTEVQKTIFQWKKRYPDTFIKFTELLKKQNTDIQVFENQIKRMDVKALTRFKKIYPELTAGSVFNPMIQTDTILLYKQINHMLCSKYGFGGMYLIFDEFSKYIEGHDKESFSSDMKIIQDVCELANTSSKEQLHITFVAHKSIKEYGVGLSKELLDAYRGVEGRIKEVMFVVSSQNNYELVKSAIIKIEPIFSEVMERAEECKQLQEESYQLPCFQGIFEKEDFLKILCRGCYPLTPVATYLLLRISEKIGQNERSIFTFIANEEPHSLADYIHTSTQGVCSVGADLVYDYFEYLLKEESSNSILHNEWLKADYAISKAKNMDEVRVLKTLALIHMVHKEEELPARNTAIRLGVGMTKEQFLEVIEELKIRQIILWRSKTRTYAFKNNVGVDIENEIKQLVHTKFTKVHLSRILKEVSELEYILPKKHNQLYAMTRYFQYEFMEVDDFLKLKSSQYLFEEHFADGKIIALLKTSERAEEGIKSNGLNHSEQMQVLRDEQCAVQEHLQQWEDLRIVAILPDEYFDQEENLKAYLAVRTLREDEEFIEQNKVLEQELALYEEDLLFEINAKLEEMYLPENGRCKVHHGQEIYQQYEDKKAFNRLLSSICGDYYNHSPRINHELVNRQSISTQIKKARNHIIDTILNHENYEAYLKGTSPEATIFRAVFVKTGLIQVQSIVEDSKQNDRGTMEVLQEIRQFIQNCENVQKSFRQLYKQLQGKNYGVRRGVIPLLLAYELSLLHDTPVIYLKNTELSIEVEVLNNININPEAYCLYVEKGTTQKEKYIQKLEELFVNNNEIRAYDKSQNRLWQLVNEIHAWYRSLSQYTMVFSPNQDEQIGKAMRGFREIFRKVELNPREVLFEKIPKLFTGFESYEAYYEGVYSIKHMLDSHLSKEKERVVQKTKIIFGNNINDNLAQCLVSWYRVQSDKAKTFLLSVKIGNLMNYIEKLQSHDEVEIIDNLAKIVTGFYIEDWNDGSFAEYVKQLTSIKSEVEMLQDEQEDIQEKNLIAFTNRDGKKIEKYFNMNEEDSTSYFLKNAISDALEEFGESLEMNQKVSVLVEMLEDLLDA